jgi:organic hydroperoxide reductase OsmC/OhrA
MSQVVSEFAIHMEQVDGYEFRVRFDKEQFAELHLDEPPPLGRDAAPNAARVLAAAVGNCLSASLLFCLKKAGHTLQGIHSDVRVQIVRTENKRLRIGAVDVVLHPRIAADSEALAKCLGSFEDFCVVTQSVRQGLDVRVRVEPEP